MADLEERILSSYPRGVATLLWKRYIDDIYVIWNHGPDKFHEFYTHMNSLHDSIKFEMFFSDKRIPFLDTMTMIHPNNTISTSLYKKPSDICSLLHALSFIPLTVKKALSIARLLDTEESYLTTKTLGHI